ncbi:cyclin-D1-1 isoform X2 [Daucus carota subsp. sativus]|uniref:cyclin-D1-1 isoform X2 n=1 Tax=Daucus carota subsp. sativus TaxID=79200 RepID=UPI0007EF14E8|nr:PREDICTED: cyclin-D1-1-like isoform X2 [Daucus carota subsp. sativus]
MSALSCTEDLFSNLLCCEDSEILSRDSPECSSAFETSADIEESIALFIEGERKYVPGVSSARKSQSESVDQAARQASVAWILKVQRYYGFQPLTAYLSVNYMDRFLNCHSLPETNGWPMQLLSTACLSLAAKMEEPMVPSLLDLQVEGAKFLFEPKTIRRMEFLVLGVLDWRLRSITPFTFLSFFAYKLDSAGTFNDFLISRATDIILLNMQVIFAEASFLEYWPSCIAAATILCAANDIPNFSYINAGHAELWCEGLRKESIVSCYRLVQGIGENTRLRKRSKASPQIRVMKRASKVSFGDSESSSSSAASSYKRRRLNNSLWVHDDLETSEQGAC